MVKLMLTRQCERFLVFPQILKLEGGRVEEMKDAESSYSELSECGYVSDVP
jgi:hypothetical protein